jgi:hypothetical protein
MKKTLKKFGKRKICACSPDMKGTDIGCCFNISQQRMGFSSSSL